MRREKIRQKRIEELKAVNLQAKEERDKQVAEQKEKAS